MSRSQLKFPVILLAVVLLGERITSASTLINSPSLSQITAPSQITVRMYRLELSGAIYEPEELCTSDNTNFGCTFFDFDRYGENAREYPYDNNPVTVPIESDYLLDVLPQEMGTYYHPTALQAQAIAARTYAYWHIDQGYTINNSNSYHVFVPLKFESLPPATANITTTEPCALEGLGASRERVCAAVAQRHYIAYGDSPGDDQPVFSEFSGDAFARTVSNPTDRAGNPSPYLLGIQDPISTACDANDFGHRHGMSQEGASRWARGNQCSYAGTGDAPWSVQWQHAAQILVHYYAGIHLWDADGAQLTDGYRWNLLDLDWHTAGNQLPAMQPGGAYSATLLVQNTSVYDWPAPDSHTTLLLSYHWAKSGYQGKYGLNEAPVTTDVSQGDVYTFTLAIDDLPDWGPCAYELQLDMAITFDRRYWFSETYAWPSYDVSINAGEPCLHLFLPLLQFP